MIRFILNDNQEIVVASKQSIENFSHSNSFVLISVRGNDDSFPRINSPYLNDCLSLVFDDIDGPLENYLAMTDDHAKQIVDFVFKYKDFPLIVCQCEAGVSRSSAMAAAIMWFFKGDDSLIFSCKYFYPNRFVYRKIVEEFIRRGCQFEPKFDQPIPSVDPKDPIF